MFPRRFVPLCDQVLEPFAPGNRRICRKPFYQIKQRASFAFQRYIQSGVTDHETCHMGHPVRTASPSVQQASQLQQLVARRHYTIARKTGYSTTATPTAFRQLEFRDGNLDRAVLNLSSYKALRAVGEPNERILA